MKDITGLQRVQFTTEWIKRGKPKTREEFIKKCCEVMGINYTPPPDIHTGREVIEPSTMFPVKD